MVEKLSAHLKIPELLQRYPFARPILDKYGLRGCGGPNGPDESLRFFARAHDIDECGLIQEIERELERQADSVTPQVESVVSGIADTIYRRFFLAAIAVATTLGASWGAVLLWKIGSGGYATVSINEINAHGQAQIFGWMGLFIMGFAYQAFPRFWHTELVAPRLALAVFGLSLSGVVMAAIGLFLGNHSKFALPLGFSGSTLELLAVAIFSCQIVLTYKRSGKRLEPYIGFIFVSLFWFLASSIYNAFHVWNLLSTISDDTLSYYASVFQPGLRDMQFYGLGMTIVLGVSLRTLPHFYDLPKPGERRAWLELFLITTAVSLIVFAGVAGRLMHYGGLVNLTAVLFSVILCVCLASFQRWKLWRQFPEEDRSSKFVRAGYVWLAIALMMPVSLPFYMAVNPSQSTHAYLAATHHAITVGFISIMIMGHAAKVVPVLNGVRKEELSRLWLPFILINAGCLLRVSTQILTDWTALAFSVMGFSGVLEVVAICLWGTHLVSIMRKGKQNEKRTTEIALSYPVVAENFVGDVLASFPETTSTFVKHGFAAVTNPFLRRTMARQVTIRQACKLHDVDIPVFLNELNSVIHSYEAEKQNS